MRKFGRSLSRQRLQKRKSDKMACCLQKDIPRGKDLCDHLGFSPEFGRKSTELCNLTHTFRRQYRTAQGILGSELKRWSSDQQELHNLVVAFLEKDHTGAKLWPATSSKVSGQIPQYPKDGKKLLNLSNVLMLHRLRAC